MIPIADSPLAKKIEAYIAAKTAAKTPEEMPTPPPEMYIAQEEKKSD